MFGWYLIEACSFLMKDKKGVFPEEGGWGGNGNSEVSRNCIQDIFMIKESIFNYKKKKINLIEAL